MPIFVFFFLLSLLSQHIIFIDVNKITILGGSHITNIGFPILLLFEAKKIKSTDVIYVMKIFFIFLYPTGTRLKIQIIDFN